MRLDHRRALRLRDQRDLDIATAEVALSLQDAASKTDQQLFTTERRWATLTREEKRMFSRNY